MIAVIHRLKDKDNKQSLGRFYLYDGVKDVFNCKSLELPDRSNNRNVSRIPSGKYICKLRWSKKYGWHFHVTNVKDRSWILIHFGNYYTDIRGCILLGNDFIDINRDGHLDVTSSKKTLSRLLKVAPQQFELNVIDLDK